MKKFLFVILAVLFATTALAIGPLSYKVEATSATGNAITTGVLDLRNADSVLVLADNGGGSGDASRNFSFKCLAPDGTTALFTSADVAVAETTTGSTAFHLNPRASAATTTTREVSYPFLPCPSMSFHLSAGGTVVGHVAAYAHGGVPLKINYYASVAAGAVVNSPVFNTEQVDQILVLVNNSAGAGSRNFTYKCLAANGTTVLWTSPTVAVSNSAPGNAAIFLDPKASSVTAATRQTVHPMPACAKMSFHVAASGSAALGMAVYAR